MEAGVDSKQVSKDITGTVQVRKDETFKQGSGSVIAHKVKQSKTKLRRWNQKNMMTACMWKWKTAWSPLNQVKRPLQGKVRVPQNEAKCSYLSSAVDIIRVPLVALQQRHVGEVLHWIRKCQEDLALLGNRTSLSQTCSLLPPRSTFLVHWEFHKTITSCPAPHYSWAVTRTDTSTSPHSPRARGLLFYFLHIRLHMLWSYMRKWGRYHRKGQVLDSEILRNVHYLSD